jgi:hypothetical protein
VPNENNVLSNVQINYTEKWRADLTSGDPYEAVKELKA